MIYDIVSEEDGIQSHITVTPILSFIYGSGMFYLGFGSFIFHGHPTDITYAHDQASILVMFVVLIGYSLFLFIRLDNLRDKWIILTLTMILQLNSDEWRQIDLYGRRNPLPNAILGQFSVEAASVMTLEAGSYFLPILYISSIGFFLYRLFIF